MKALETKRLIGNTEDIMSLRVLEIKDIYEVGLGEIYAEVIERPVLPIGNSTLNRSK